MDSANKDSNPTPSLIVKRGKCRKCGRQRLIVNQEWHTCQSCTQAILLGTSPVPEIKKRGRHKLQPVTIPESNLVRQPAPAAPAAPTPEPAPEPMAAPASQPAQASPAPEPAPVTSSRKAPTCKRCGNDTDEYGEQQCSKCGTWYDYRGTDAVKADDVLVCKRCGAILPLRTIRCNHCGFH